MVNVFVATPMYGGQCAGYYAQSLLRMHGASAGKYGLTFSFMFNESLITRARNALAHGFLKSKSTHLFFIDADIKFEPQYLEQMLAADKPVIAGIYPKKEINWISVKNAIEKDVPIDKLKFYTGSHVVNLREGEASKTVDANQPTEVARAGTGFMLIKREVLEQLKEVVPRYLNDVNDIGGSIAPKEEICEFFATSIAPDSRRLLSEDYHFCDLCVAHGIGIFVAPWVQLSHIGTYTFDGRLPGSVV